MGQNNEPDNLLEEAIDWLLRLQNVQEDPVVSQQFTLWLKRSDAHEEAWQKAQQVWSLMGQAEPVYENLWLEQSADADRDVFIPVTPKLQQNFVKPSLWRKVQFSALSIAVVAILFFATPVLILRIEADYRTTTAQTETVTLSDGSKIILAANSAVAVDVTETRRHVRLLRGEAYFDVIKDAGRPFFVAAGEAEVFVLGTAFDVKLTENGTTVALERGTVEVRDTLHPDQQSARLFPGDKVELERGTDNLIRSTVNPTEIAGWRNGYLFVEDATVRSVIEELQRYHHAWITLTDRTLNEERVTGLYNLNEPDRALRALVQPYGGTVRSVSPYLRVISRSN